MLTMTNTIKYIALFAFILMFTAVTNAATYVVDRNDDVTATACTAAANDCSLRGAIRNANANGSGADTINFNVGGGNSQTITMSSTPLPDIQTKQLVTIRFDVAANIFGGPIPLIMGDSPVFREVSDVDANVLAANFLDGTIDILGPSSASVSVGGSIVSSPGQPVAHASISLTDMNGNTRTVKTNPFGSFRFDDVAAGETYTLSVNAKGSQSVQQLIPVTDEITDIQIVLQPIE